MPTDSHLGFTEQPTPSADRRASKQSRVKFPSPAAPSALKGLSVRGGAAALFGQALSSALQIGSTIVLARLLSPADYGLQSMVLSVTNFFSLFKDAGLSTAVIQRENLTHDQVSALFWINVGVGMALTILTVGMAPILVLFFKEPRLLWVTVASSSVFLFNSVAFQHHALLDRSMRFVTSMKIGIASMTIATALAILMAALGYRYWALIAQNICIPVVDAALVWTVLRWRPGRPRRASGIRAMLRFGGAVSLNSVVVYLAYNAEKILLGRFWGAASLGLYGRAYQLANLPVQQLTSSVGSVAFPVLSRMQSDAERLRRSYLKIHSLVVSMTVPIVVLCALFADEIVRLLLGPKWLEAAVVLRLLAPTALAFAVINPLSWLLRATGQVGRSLRIAVLIAPVVILGVTAGLRHGPPGVAVGYSCAMVLLSAPVVAWAKHGTAIRTADYIDCIKRPLAAGAVAGAASWLFKIAFGGPLNLGLLALGLTIFFAVYITVLLFVLGQKDLYFDVLSELTQRKRSSPAQCLA